MKMYLCLDLFVFDSDDFFVTLDVLELLLIADGGEGEGDDEGGGRECRG